MTIEFYNHDTRKYEVAEIPDYEERIDWTKAEEDCEKALDKLRESAKATGDDMKKAVREAIEKQMKSADNVNHPSHYCDGKIEPIEYIEDKNLGYHLGNVVKYISRAGKKDPTKTIEDLKKARWYLNRHIERLETASEKEV